MYFFSFNWKTHFSLLGKRGPHQRPPTLPTHNRNVKVLEGFSEFEKEVKIDTSGLRREGLSS